MGTFCFFRSRKKQNVPKNPKTMALPEKNATLTDKLLLA
jgi:hypothetical protein